MSTSVYSILSKAWVIFHNQLAYVMDVLI